MFAQPQSALFPKEWYDLYDAPHLSETSFRNPEYCSTMRIFLLQMSRLKVSSIHSIAAPLTQELCFGTFQFHPARVTYLKLCGVAEGSVLVMCDAMQ